jgi:hypothetical protein
MWALLLIIGLPLVLAAIAAYLIVRVALAVVRLVFAAVFSLRPRRVVLR